MSIRLCVLVFILGFSSNAAAFKNEDFEALRSKQPLVTWGEFSPLWDAALKCNSTMAATCKEIMATMSYQLGLSFVQANVINETAPAKQFCDDFAMKLISTNDVGGMNAYSVLLLGGRIEYGEALYGPSFSHIYLARILADALLASKPCK